MVIDLMVHCRYVQIPMIGVRPTEFADGIPSVSVSVDQARATLVLDACVPGNLDRYPLFSGSMDILLSDEPPNASDLMISSSPYQEEVRDKVHAIYHLLYTRYEYFIRKAGSIRYTTPDVPLTLASLFSQIQDWKYRIGDEHWKQFPKQPKEIGLNPLFVDDQLIGKDRWNSIKAAIESTTKVDQLELELERIRSRLHWGYRRFATIEAAIVIEILLNEYAMRQLQNKGFSKTKLAFQKPSLVCLTIIFPFRAS